MVAGLVCECAAWLMIRPKNVKAGFKKPGPDGMGLYRAVILSGPPGIGKTTSAHLVAKLEGYDILEYNASDTRNEKLLREKLAGVTDNTSISGFMKHDVSSSWTYLTAGLPSIIHKTRSNHGRD
jgi:replication factor C subunit 1